MAAVTVIYALLFCAAAAIFVGGLLYKIYRYARTPQPLGIPTTPAPLTRAGVAWRMTKEVIAFESLFKANKWNWFFGWLFHAALVLALIHHLNILVGGMLMPLEFLGRYAGAPLLLGLAGLWARRVFVDRVRYISTPSDHLMLALLVTLALSGIAMRHFAYPDLPTLHAFFAGLIGFDWQPLPAQPLLLLHLALAAILAMLFPVSKLLHAPGVFFSPTRNQVDNARERRRAVGRTAK